MKRAALILCLALPACTHTINNAIVVRGTIPCRLAVDIHDVPVLVHNSKGEQVEAIAGTIPAGTLLVSDPDMTDEEKARAMELKLNAIAPKPTP